MTKTKKRLGYGSVRDRNVFLLCWLAYSATYICRLNFSSVIPALTEAGVFSESRIASVSSAFFICYGLGQIVSGVVGDRLRTDRMIFYGVFLSAVTNLLIFFFHTYWALLLLWAANGLFQSLVWSPILKLASVEYNAEDRERFGMQMSTTVPVGTVFSYCVSLLTMLVLPWRFVFLTCGGVLLAVALVWLFGVRRLHLQQPVPVAQSGKTAAKGTLSKVFTGSLLLLLVPIVAQGTLKDSVTQWVPDFFADQFKLSVSFSLLLTMVLPVINVTGAFLARWVNRYLRSEVRTSAVFFGIALVFLLALPFAARHSAVLSLIAMVMITNCMFAINVMLITLVPLHFAEQGVVCTVAGVLNATAYIGCAVMNQLAGGLLERRSWLAVLVFWAVLCLVAILFCLPGTARERKAQTP